MKLRKFSGRTSRSVLEQVRSEFGTDAMIVADHATADGVEVTTLAGDALDTLLGQSPSRSRGDVPPAEPLSAAIATADAERVARPVLPAPVGRVVVADQIGPQLAAELEVMRQVIDQRFALMSRNEDLRGRPLAARISCELLTAGFGAALVRSITGRLPDDMNAAQARDWIVKVLARNLRCIDASDDSRDRSCTSPHPERSSMDTATGILDVEQRVCDFAPLVRRLAHHLAAKLPASVQIDDIIQAGMIGLMDAASRFEEAQGCQFETFASQRIRGAMLDELRQNDWLPRSIRKSLRTLEAGIARLEQQLGRAPTEKEIAAELGLSLPAYHDLLQDARGYQLLHLEDFARDDEDGYLDRHLPDERENPFERCKDARFTAALVEAIEHLPPREKLLLGLYYEQELNFKEIAAVLEVSESRVCQLHGQAVARLRAKLTEW